MTKLQSLLALCTLTALQIHGMHKQYTITYEHKIRYTDSRDAILALKNNSMIGLIMYDKNAISWMRVDKKYQGQGIGSELFVQCLETIAQDYDRAHWLAEKSIPFYQRFGARICDPYYAPKTSSDAEMEFVFKRDGNPRENLSNVPRKS